MRQILEISLLFVPLFALMAVGALSRFLPGSYQLMFNEDRQKFLDQLVYRFALPAGTFLSVSRLEVLPGGEMPRVLGTILLCAVVLVCVGALARAAVLRRWGRDVGATVALAAVSQNALYLGLPVINIMVLRDPRAFALGSIYSALSIPFMVTGVLITLHLFGNKQTNRRTAFRNLVTDPVLISITLGLLVRLIGIRLPSIVVAPLDLLGAMATPLVLLVIGSRLRLRLRSSLRKPLLLSVITSVIFSPLLAFAVSRYVFALGPETVFLLTMIFGMPLALSSSAFLTNAGVEDQELNVATITVTTLAILITMPLWRFLVMGS